MVDLTSCIGPLGCGIGLPEIILWVLTFAIAYAALKYLTNKRSAALIAIALAFLVLMAVPATLITFISSMTTGLVAVAIGVIALMAVLAMTGAVPNWTFKYMTPIALVVALIAVAMFVGFGGLGFIGISGIPTITGGMWLLILVAAAVLWMLAEPSPREAKPTKQNS